MARACRPSRSARRDQRFSRTVRLLNMRRPCGTSATPRAAIVSGGSRVTGVPNTYDPAVARRQQPMLTFMQVDLPAPLRPRRPSSRPSPSRERHASAARDCRRSRHRFAETERVIRQDRPPACADRLDDFGAGAFDDDLAEMQERDAVGEFQRDVHVVLDHDDGDVARNGRQELAHIAPLVDRQAGERLVEQQHFGILRQRHGDLDTPPFAVGGLRQRPPGDVVETDAGERGMRAVSHQIRLTVEPDERIPAQPAIARATPA